MKIIFKKSISLVASLLLFAQLNCCSNKSSKEWKDIAINEFQLSVLKNCSVKKNDNHNGAGQISCSSFSLYYEHGSFVDELLLDTLMESDVLVDTVGSLLRTIVLPKEGKQGEMVLMLDDRSSQLDEGELRLVRKLKIWTDNYEPGDKPVILTIFKSAKSKS